MFEQPSYGKDTLICKRVISFPMFTKSQCTRMLKKIEEYSKHAPKHRPNSMNNYGTILPKEEMTTLIDFVNAHSKKFKDIGGQNLFLSHAFTVQYKHGEDLSLDMHTDDSDVTCNVCLGKEFMGGDLAFCGLQYENTHRKLRHIYVHKIGYAVMHPGNQRHGALPIIKGERVNLIMWFKSRIPIPRQPYIRGSSDPVCVSHTHDGDGSKNNGVQYYRDMSPFVIMSHKLS